MLRKFLLTTFISGTLLSANAQSSKNQAANRFADFSTVFGESETALSASYVYNWQLGKKKNWEAGLGLRLTSYFGQKKDFVTAPANLARSTTAPFLIVFADQLTQNWDTLQVQRPFSNSLNLSGNFGYNFSKKLSVGFNIDIIGFTVGRTTSAVLTSNGVTKTEIAAKPSPFNLLLTGDNDLGSLNSEFFLKYRIDNHWAIKADYQFLFVEYTTTTIKQTAPDGTMVDRFRNKSNLLGVGVSYYF